MLARLSIRDIVLIDELELEFSRGLTILTGETGAGKSILLDALSLALGARGDGGLVRAGAAQGQVTAVFEPPAGHPVFAALAAQDLAADGELILRRVQLADGRTRAYVNDQQRQRADAARPRGGLVEIHGQHDERALLDAGGPPRRWLTPTAAFARSPRRFAPRTARCAPARANSPPRAPTSRRASARPISRATPARS